MYTDQDFENLLKNLGNKDISVSTIKDFTKWIYNEAKGVEIEYEDGFDWIEDKTKKFSR